MDDILSLKKVFLEESQSVVSISELQQLRIKYLGKKGLVTSQLKTLSEISPELRPEFGKAVNEVKNYIDDELKKIEGSLKEDEHKKRILSETIDITLPGKFVPFGREHPINKVLCEIVNIFLSMGFEVEEGPEVELDYYNFEALNIPKDHPARDMQDTFYISDDVILRTHTSPVQIRVMEKRKPPLKVIAPGKVYRCDADISHTPMFHQVEGFMVDTDIAFSDLKGVLELFIHSFFSVETPVRFRPSYFPFTEPSAEIDIGCNFCSGKGCRVCKNTGWLEILGAGMIHPKVFEMVDTDIAFSDLKGVLESFIHSFFSAETPVRFRPSYFPFTEPSAEIDIGCNFCSGKGCRVCKNTGWLEILGAGMIHPKVFEMVGYDKELYTGFAFGMGVERLTMLKYSIDDIRLFFENDIRFLRQF